MGEQIDLEKYRSIGSVKSGAKKSTKKTPNIDRGKIVGFQTEHWDGRVDATIRANPASLRATTKGVD